MKKICVLLTAVFLAASVAWGQNEWGLFAAYWNTDDADDALGVGIKVAIEIIPVVQLEIRGTYFEDFEAGNDFANSEVEVIPLEVGLLLTVPFNETVEGFVGGGIGYYFMDGDVDLPTGTQMDAGPDDEIGGYVSAGLKLPVWKSGASFGETQAVLFGEVTYRFVDAEDIKVESGPEISLKDADLNGVGFNAGLLVRW